MTVVSWVSVVVVLVVAVMVEVSVVVVGLVAVVVVTVVEVSVVVVGVVAVVVMVVNEVSVVVVSGGSPAITSFPYRAETGMSPQTLTPAVEAALLAKAHDAPFQYSRIVDASARASLTQIVAVPSVMGVTCTSK